VLLKKVGLVDKEVRVSVRMAEKQKLTHKQILDLAMLGKSIEQHYYFPQEIEWAIEKNKIYIVQVKLIGGKGRGNDKGGNELAMTGSLKPSEKLQLVLKGSAASDGIATGPVRVVRSAKDITKVHAGDILVCEQTSRDYLAGIKRAGAVVTDYGGGASHGSIVSRDLGIPAVVGTGSATKLLKEGSIVTINGLKGEVYKGSLGIPAMTTNLRTATKIYVDLSQPELASKVAAENVDGVGLLRGEVMMPEGKGGIYVNKLAEQVSSICREFAPRSVVYRLSDFETTGSNPMLGFHGSFRHIQNPEAFKIEIEAIKTARQQDSCKNLWMMIPFCRSVEELMEIKRIMALSGLRRSPTFKLWMMVEVPSNVILLEEFIKAGIDGVSIGLNNLTTLLLGIDRGDSEVSRSFDSMNPAVLWAIERIIKACHKHGISSSVGGQDVWMNPDLLEKMIEWGIGSVSVTSDVTKSVRETIFEIERRLIEKRYHGKN
jgi:pyruvate,water dikinase